MAIATLVLVRHGETVVNVRGLMHKDKDVAKLTKLGRVQIEKTAEELKRLGVNKLYSSKEERAMESAKIISERLGIKVKSIDGLEERQWGKLEGKSWEEIKKVLDKMTLDERYTYTPEGGESWRTCVERLFEAIKKIVKDDEGDNVAIVTHGGAIRMLIPHLANEPKETSFKYNPPNASVSIFNYSNGEFSRVKVLSTSHLENVN